MIPFDLRPTYGGSVQVVRSLKTSDWREAGRLGALRRAALLPEFEDKRRALNPQPVAQIAPKLDATQATDIPAGMLQRDDAVRSSPVSAEIWLRFIEWVKGARIDQGTAIQSRVYLERRHCVSGSVQRSRRDQQRDARPGGRMMA